MIFLQEIVKKLDLDLLGAEGWENRSVSAGYAADLLSCVMKSAKKDWIWVTLQSHLNVVAVASLLNLAGVIITEGHRPDDDTIARAQKEGVVLMLTPKTTFSVVGELTAMGVGGV